ncbi:MAG: anaerobic ribonucleoside-triphosphate reductase [Halochromatium sp.]|uniref:anaerobic ribonucleoside-triphosphate reductase n=1 Tax=Halochromatium sp. TaxID=2049430 RepID=UPI00397A64D6
MTETTPPTYTPCDLDDPALADAERTPCERWTRVMGYHRPVSSFNTGKQAEHAERVYFRTDKALASVEE